jgi:hypothetical protein
MAAIKSTPTPTPTAKTVAPVHAPKETRMLVARAHGDSSEALAARVRAVGAALATGTDVKTLAADLAADVKAGTIDDSTGAPVEAVSETILGFAKAVLTKTGHVAVLADTYRAIKRHGIKSTPKALASVAASGRTVADKMAVLGEESAKAKARPKATPTARAPRAPQPKAGAGVVHTITAPTSPDELVKLLTVATASITAGRITPDAKTLASVEGLLGAIKASLAAKATPASVAKAGASK